MSRKFHPKRWRCYCKRCLAFLLAAVMTFEVAVPQNVRAAMSGGDETYIYLDAAEMPDEIMDADTFYVGTTSADLNENVGASYLLQIGRGGDAEEAASVTLKITDATASYGDDYRVYTYDDSSEDGGIEADNPEDNQSLLDMIEENEVEEDLQISDEEREAAQQENLENLEEGAAEYIESLLGDTEDSDEESETVNNPLAQAKENLTGIQSDRQNVTSSQQTVVDVLSDVSNSITDALIGATLEVEFAPGETTKYVEIQPIDNDESDGDRIFYVTLSEPSEGMTNSAVSESIFTIVDDEPEQDAVVSFESEEITVEEGTDSVEVVLKRSGAMTQMVTVHMDSDAGSAVSGQDFAPVDADVYFPFGVDTRKLQITVDSQYLTGDADFYLSISDGTGATVGEISQTRVVLKKESTAESEDEPEEEVSAQASLSDVKYGTTINLYNAMYKVRGNAGTPSVGASDSNSMGRIASAVDDTWIDFAIALSGNKNSVTRQYIYDGFTFTWRKYSSKSSWSSANVAYYRAGESSDIKVFISTGDKPRFDWQTLTYYFGATDAAAIKFYNRNWRGKKNTLDVETVRPILRPFKVQLAAASSLSYLTGSGTTKQANANAVASTLTDSSGGYAVKYAGDNMVITQDNASLGISRLTGVKIVSTVSGSNASKTIDSKYLNGFKAGDSKIQVTLNNDFCTEYASYISYSANGSGGSMYGNIKLQPVYGYIDSKVTVNKNTETTASGSTVDCSVTINGQAVTYGTEVTYHMGDVLTFQTQMSNDDYVATGIEMSFYNNSLKQNESNQYGYSSGSYKFSPKSVESYTVIPIFTENDNRIVVQVSEEDVAKFKATGIFDEAYLKEYATLSNGHYNIEVISTDQIKDKVGTSFTLAAEAEDGYIPIWQETNSDRYFMGSTFEYTAKTRRTANIVYLYAAETSDSYAAVKGQVYYANLMLNNTTAAGDPIMPAEGAYMSVAGQFAVADEDGQVQTTAFALPGTITKNGETVEISKPYVRALVGASGATQYSDIELDISGNEISLADAEGIRRTAHLTDLSAVNLSVNTGDSTYFSGIYIKNKSYPTDTAYMNDESTSITVNVIEQNGEEVTAVDFLIYDCRTNALKQTISAVEGANYTWTGTYTFKSEGESTYAQGDRIFVQMTTNKSADVMENVDADGNPIYSSDELSAEAQAALSKTVYAPVNTGYTLVKDGQYEDPTTQSLDIGSLNGLSGIPLVNNFNTDLSIGPVSLEAENLYDDQQKVCGTRLKVTVDLDFEKTRFASSNYEVSDDGVNYDVSALTLLKDFGKVKSSYKAAADNILNAKSVGKTGMASMGASKWGVYPSVGFYLDFAIAYEMDSTGTVIDSSLVLQGGGIYLGASANFSVAWYALIPIVYIPCYFGVAGTISLALQAGATTTVTDTKEQIVYEDFTATSHNLSETLDFDFEFSAAASVQVYCGVGICGTLGVRGGLDTKAEFTWYPTLHNHYSYFDSVGFTFTVGFAMWIDLLLFTIPVPVYTIAEKDYGLNAQYEELKDANEDDLNTIIQNNEVSTSSADVDLGEEYEDTDEITYQIKARDNTPSEWSGDMTETAANEVSTMATYKETNSHTILTDGYDRPDSQMIDMGEYGTLLVFLQDDITREDTERTAISYSVYSDGAYSEPVIIQTDGTADYQPSLTEAGDNILITWISSDPDVDKGSESDDSYSMSYLMSQEVYTVSVAKADLAAHKEITQSDIVQLTEDEYYDSEPVAVYDEQSGDINIYYVKSAADTEAEDVEATDLANPLNLSESTYSVIAYRIYDASAGEWVVTEYEPNEKSDEVTDLEYVAQLEELGGQRMLESPIQDDDIDMEDPLISDFTAIAYNGVAVFAYSIDKDNSIDTTDDRDMFIQVYDFETRSTYKPVRITDDDLADLTPQIVRNGGDEDGTTYLFWRREDTLAYIDVSRLIKYGIDEDGQILESALDTAEDVGSEDDGPDEEYTDMTDEEIEKNDYAFEIYQVDAYGDTENQYASYSDYQVATDAQDNIYIIWVDNGDSSGESSSQEIYASAMINADLSTYDSSNDDEEGVETSEVTKSWSSPNKLTDFGVYCDEPALAITEEGKMLMVYNKYDIGYDDEGSPSATDIELASSLLEPYGSMEVTSITLSDQTPVEGDEVEIGVRFENTGLTAATEGFTATVYEKTSDGTRTVLDTYEYEGDLIATGIVDTTFTYTASQSTPGSTIEVEVIENGLEGTNISESNEFLEETDYAISENNAYEGQDSKFYSVVTITNTGNKASDGGDELQILFTGPYADAASYGLEDDVLACQTISLDVGESETVTLELDLPASVFSYYGNINTEATMVNKDGEAYEDTLADTIYMSQPAELVLNNNEDMEMTAGDEEELEFQYVTCSSLGEVTAVYTSSDDSVARVVDGTLKAVGEGSAEITAYAYPYKSAATISVNVTAKDSDTDASAATDNTGDTNSSGGTASSTSLSQVKIKKMVSRKAKQLNVKWKKVEGADGYEITYATDKAFTKNVKTKTTTKTSINLKKLNQKKTWYIKVRAYKNEGSGTVTGEYSKVSNIRLSARPKKVKKVTVTAVGTKKLSVQVGKVKGATGYEIIVSTDKAGKKNVTKKTTKKRKILLTMKKAGKQYYITVRAYKKTSGGGYLYSAKRVIKKIIR